MALVQSSKPPYKSMVYVGYSMNPFLKDLDIIYFESCPYNTLTSGDVIVFKYNGTDKAITHRIISLDANGIRTRGDNNPLPDQCTLKADEIIGRVVYARRGNRQFYIYGGFIGRITGAYYRMSRLFKRTIYRLLSLPYHYIARIGIFRPFFPIHKLRTITIHGPDKVIVKLIIGDRVIGRYEQGWDKWQIYPPYKLFINESSLAGIIGRNNVIMRNSDGPKNG